MASCNSLGDEILATTKVNLPSVESLMASPLSKFLQFAANKCGCAGTIYALIATWVHPLFLKAKTEAELILVDANEFGVKT